MGKTSKATKKATTTSRRKVQKRVVPCEPIGVYKWPFKTADVHAICDQVWGDRSKKALSEARTQLTNLVLIELLVTSDTLDLGGLAQDSPAKRNENSQVPYDESYWSADGSAYIAHYDAPAETPYRVVFFLHEFDDAKPLYTPDGIRIALPERSRLPARLRKVIDHYDCP